MTKKLWLYTYNSKVRHLQFDPVHTWRGRCGRGPAWYSRWKGSTPAEQEICMSLRKCKACEKIEEQDDHREKEGTTMAATTEEVFRVFQSKLADEVSRVIEEIKRDHCRGCQHSYAEFHHEDGCWFTVTLGKEGSNMVCPCGVGYQPTP